MVHHLVPRDLRPLHPILAVVLTVVGIALAGLAGFLTVMIGAD